MKIEEVSANHIHENWNEIGCNLRKIEILGDEVDDDRSKKIGETIHFFMSSIHIIMLFDHQDSFKLYLTSLLSIFLFTNVSMSWSCLT